MDELTKTEFGDDFSQASVDHLRGHDEHVTTPDPGPYTLTATANPAAACGEIPA